MILKSLFSSKQEQIYSLSYGKLFYTKYNNISCSKITLKSGNTKSYEVFKTHTHPNILPIIKLSQSSVYTKRIIPFIQEFDKNKTEYNQYVVLKVKEAVNFINSVLKKEHRAIGMESIMLEESGKVLLCNFEKMAPTESYEIDNKMISDLSIYLTGDKNIKNEDINEEFYDKIFKLDLAILKTEEKIKIFEEYLLEKLLLPKITVRYFFNIFEKDAIKETDKEYKEKIFESLYNLDEEYFNENLKRYFSILDSNIRLYLLNKFMNKKFTNLELDDITSDLSLGLQVKDKIVKKTTVDFIFQHSFGNEAMLFLLETMAECNDSETMILICNYLLKLDKKGYEKSIYKIILSYLTSNKNTLLVYECIDKYYSEFDKIKITKEVLPNLCSKLIEKETQEYCFILVEKILNFLKGHKDEIQNKDWTLKSLTGMFSKKSSNSNKFEERVSRFSKEELDEWNDIEME